MKKTVIIKKNYEFRTILKRGTSYRGKTLNIFVLRKKEKINRIGIAVSKKSGNSVKRNKIKRLIRENYRKLEEKLDTGNNIIVLWKMSKDFGKPDFYDIQEDMKNLFIKSKIYRG